MSVSKLAQALDVTEGHLRQVENGTRGPLSIDASRAAAAFLGASAEPLVEAYVDRRGFVLLDVPDEMRRAVAVRLALAWPLLTDEELVQVNNTLAAMRLPDGRRVT